MTLNLRICLWAAGKLSLFVVFLIATASSAQDPRIRSSISTQGDFWVGQRITIAVELLAPGIFAGTPVFHLPDPPGLLLLPPSGSPTPSSEEIDGISYAIQRHEVFAFAQRAGAQSIPGFSVRFQFKRHPLDKEVIGGTVETKPIQFIAKLPPGADGLNHIISARGLTAVEQWRPQPGPAKAGDAFTRTITSMAPDIPAMAFTPFPTGRIDGLGIYPKPPEVVDQSDRGQLRGQRRDTVVYVCQRPGHFVVPASRLTWFDLDAQKLQIIDFPARTLDVVPNPSMATQSTPAKAAVEKPTHRLVLGLVAALVANILALVAWHFRSVCRPFLALFRPVHLAPLNPGIPPQSSDL